MTGIDSLLRSVSPAPTDSAEVEGWLAVQEAEMAARVRAALDATVQAVWLAYVGEPVTAGLTDAELAAVSVWEAAMPDMADLTAEVYAEGALSAYVTGAKHGFVPSNVWEPVVNRRAVDFMSNADNRLAAVGDTTWRGIRQRITDGINNGDDRETIKRSVEDFAGFNEFRSDTIARTEMLGAYNHGHADGVSGLGAAGPTMKAWLATRDRRTRDTHAAMNDVTVAMSAPFMVGGWPMQHPGDHSGPAGEVINCRCVVRYYWPGDTLPDGTVAGEQLGTMKVDETPAVVAPSTSAYNTTGLDFTAPDAPIAMAQVSDDLTRLYNDALAPTGLRVQSIDVDDKLGWSAEIRTLDGREAGIIQRRFEREDDGTLTVHHDYWELMKDFQGQGVATRLNALADDYYRSVGVKRVMLNANIDVGGYSWARQGFDLDVSIGLGGEQRAARQMRNMLDRIDKSADALGVAERSEWVAEMSAMRARLGDVSGRHTNYVRPPDFPTMAEVSQMGKGLGTALTPDGVPTWPGKSGMLGSDWHGVKLLAK